MSKETQKEISQICDEIKSFLIAKNISYGDSALEPVRIFSKLDTVAQIAIRIDDKLSRVSRGHEFPGDDTIDDLIGYLILLKIAGKRSNG
jgi:hypothetical protein